MSAPATNKVRLYILTASVAAITATGAWYGAGLKARQEYKQERNVLLQATPAERIKQMETVRSRLLQQKLELQAKIDKVTAGDSSPGQNATQQNR